ncbi:hypothetical protein ACVWXN_007166 [Bradyrhizobium sp. i1.4.4]|uniref:NAD(P)-dependent oxidoreductase n=1 Tax=Bradyrhizobium sp. LA6.10 TaxID=3156318 RepID=UPI00339274FE
MGVLVSAKRYDRVVRLADRREWTSCAPGRMELDGSRALVVDMGAIGRRIATRLVAFGVVVEGATRSGSNDTLGPDEWRARLGDLDWVVLAAPTTAESRSKHRGETTMDHYAGIDVSLECSSVCVVDANGKIVRETKVASEPEALIAWLGSLGFDLARIGLEAGPLSQWLYAAMKRADLTVELLETRHTFKWCCCAGFEKRVRAMSLLDTKAGC